MSSDGASTLREALDGAELDGGPVRWTVTNPTADTDAEADRAGLTERRDVLQLRRPLPLPPEVVLMSPPAPTRAFVPGSDDEAAWIDVNNRAFADHPDQSRFTPERLHALMAEPWFDPEGFRLHERGGVVVAFCWTKVHPAERGSGALGEIFAIGVDPRVQGLGLGRSLTVAGLTWLTDQGIDTAMLYVDAENLPARTLYDRLGFVQHHTDRLYESPGGEDGGGVS